MLDRGQNRIEEALKTYRELAQKYPEIYLPYVAMTLNNLGILDSDLNRMAEARKEYEEALKCTARCSFAHLHLMPQWIFAVTRNSGKEPVYGSS